MTVTKRKDDVFGDGIAFVEKWDFSTANMNEENRIKAITQVASICYDNPNIVGKESLYNRLKAESIGLPSSSFEFVPVLLNEDKMFDILTAFMNKSTSLDTDLDSPNILKYGELIHDDGVKYLLTNYRAILYDYEEVKDYTEADFTQFFNTKKECDIIAKHNRTYLYKMDMATSKQHIRHRVNHQELSRRYVSGKKTPFDFYVSQDIKESSKYDAVEEHIDNSLRLYQELLNECVQPQSARRVIPQSAYTTIWSSFLPKQWDNYIALRTDKHAQWEIRQLANAMEDME